MQNDDPSDENVPAGHKVQDVIVEEPMNDETVPAGQSMQVLELYISEYVPGEQ